MDTIKFKVGEDEYQLIPHTGFSAINLDRRVTGLMGRFYGLEAGANEKSVLSALASVLDSYSSSDYRWLVEETLNRVTVITEGKKSFSLGNMDLIANHFCGKYQELYAVLFEVWQKEKFSPFAEAPEPGPTGN